MPPEELGWHEEMGLNKRVVRKGLKEKQQWSELDGES